MKHYLNDLIVVLVCCITVAIVTFIESARVDDLQKQLAEITTQLKTVEEVFEQADKLKTRINHVNPRADAQEIAYTILRLSNKYQVDHHQIAAQAEVESSYNVNAIGRLGERGLLQVMPATFKEHGQGDINDWFNSADAGVAYIAWLQRHYSDSVLASYNAGPNRRGKRQIASRYVAKVNRRMEVLR